MAPTNADRADQIGGNFPLVIGQAGAPLPRGVAFESARAAMSAYISSLKPARIHAPSYTCKAVKSLCRETGAVILSYNLSDFFAPRLTTAPDPGDLIIVNNYFGLCEDVIRRFVADHTNVRILVDNAQAYFASEIAGTDAVNSARKFLPVPDGAFLRSSQTIDLLPPDEGSSVERSRCLALSAAGLHLDARIAYLEAENSLVDCQHRSMSIFTKKMISSLDASFIRRRRTTNYEYLSLALADIAQPLPCGNQVPLVFPLMGVDADAIKARLIDERIYCPHFWPDVTAGSKLEETLTRQTVFIPIDHRYGPTDLDRVISVIRQTKRLN